MKKTISLALLTSLLLNACVKDELVDLKNLSTDESQSASKNALAANAAIEMVPNEMLIKFKPDVNATGRANALARMNAQVSEHIHTNAMKSSGDRSGIYLVRVPIDVISAVSKAKAFSEVEYAEPNFIYRHQATSNDTYVTNGSLWGMTGTNGSGASVQWGKGNIGSNTVIVGIIDEGVMFNHNDLRDNMWINPAEQTADGIDNDRNGYVDDIRGWDFASNDNTTFDGSTDDHGTHVAGTIGGKGGNGTGVAGVCWNVKMITAKFLGRNGGTTGNAVKAVDYFTDLKKNNGIDVVATNNSWGGGGFSTALYDAIERANSANILFIAAAGNSGANIDNPPSYPAGYSNANIISVASITSSGALSSFSNFGKSNVDLGAPGSGIFSTVPSRNLGSAYASYSGTSMATPHVTGACALYRSITGQTNAATIKAAILNTASTQANQLSTLKDRTVTGGRLNVSGW